MVYTDPKEFDRIHGIPSAKDYQGRKSAEAWQQRELPDVSVGGTKPIPVARTRALSMPTDPAERKKLPIATGVLDYFPDALLAVAEVSYLGNIQHNPGQPLHWDRSKSTDEADTMIRHYMERGTRDKDGARHSAKMVWRALAYLQKEIEEETEGDYQI